MIHLIDKDVLVAEIEKRMQELHPTNTHQMQVGEKIDRDVLMWLNALTWVLKNINTLEEKEVDLDEEIEKCLKQHHMLAVGKKEFTDIAEHFFELGLKAQKGI